MPSKPKLTQRLNGCPSLPFAGLLGLLVAAVLLLIFMAWPVAANQAVEWLRLLALGLGAAIGVGAGGYLIARALPRPLAPAPLREADFNPLMMANPAVIYRIDLRSNVRDRLDYISPNLPAVLGYAPAELGDISHWWRQHIHPDDVAKAELDGDFAHWGQQEKRRQYRLLQSNGHFKWVCDTTRLVRDADGAPNFLIGALLDIDAQMQLQLRLEEEQTRYRLIAEHAEDIIGLHTPELRLQWLSGSTRAILGYKPEQLLSIDILKIIHPDDWPVFGAKPWRVFATQDLVQTWVYRISTAFGAWRWFETRATPIFDDQGRLSAIQTVSRDINQRVLMARKLAESEQMYRSIFENMDAVVFTVGVEPDGEFMFLACNDAHTRLTGISPADFIRHRPHEILPPDLADWVVENYQHCVARREPIRYAQRVLGMEGNPFLNIVLTPIFDEEGAVSMIIGLGVDQTEQQKLFLELKQTAAQLQHVKDIAQLGSFELDISAKTCAPSVLLMRWFDGAHDNVCALPTPQQDEWRAFPEPAPGANLLAVNLPELNLPELNLPGAFLPLMGLLSYVSAIDQQRLALMLNRLWEKDAPRLHATVLMRRSDGLERSIIWDVQLVWSEAGAPVMLEGTLQDVTDRVTAEQAMARTNRRDAAVLHTVGEGIFGVDAMGKMSFANPAARRLLGFGTQQLTGLDVAELVYGEYPPASGFLAALGDGIPRTGLQERFWRRGEGLFPVHLSVAVLPDDFDAKRNGLVVVFSDISEIKRHERLLEMMAITDELTGLPNRRYFLQRLDEEFERARRYNLPTSVLMLDLDYFKRINDEYGHAAGDELLRQFARTLQSLLRRQDISGRLGGEEFAVLMPNTPCLHAFEIAERLRAAIGHIALAWEGSIIQCTVSVGVGDLLDGASSASEGLSRADKALYLAKAQGRNQVSGCTNLANDAV